MPKLELRVQKSKIKTSDHYACSVCRSIISGRRTFTSGFEKARHICYHCGHIVCAGCAIHDSSQTDRRYSTYLCVHCDQQVGHSFAAPGKLRLDEYRRWSRERTKDLGHMHSGREVAGEAFEEISGIGHLAVIDPKQAMGAPIGGGAGHRSEGKRYAPPTSSGITYTCDICSRPRVTSDRINNCSHCHSLFCHSCQSPKDLALRPNVCKRCVP